MGKFDTVRVLSFDCYGTLIDSGEGVLAALGGWRDRNLLDISDRELLDAFDRHEAAQEVVEPKALYPQILEKTLAAMGDELGAVPTPRRAGRIRCLVGDWPAFEDSAESLIRLSAQFKLIVVSNVDRPPSPRARRSSA
jgi:putative hydrolase of the HAD superfamily